MGFNGANERARNGSSKNRDRLDIVRDMLSAALAKAKKTKIMYKANLNFGQVEKYLKIILEVGLLEYEGNSFYSVTQKGREFLRVYDDYVEGRRRVVEQINGNVKTRVLLESMCFGSNCSGASKSNKRKV
jgi:predicted transcriptional regulator